MGINTVDNFGYKGPKFNFERDAFDTLIEMKACPETAIPPKGFRCYCAETDKYYKFNASNSVDPITGKWREDSVDIDNIVLKTSQDLTPEEKEQVLTNIGAVGRQITEGGEVFNDYENNNASGLNSHVEGSGNTASGTSAHAEGVNNTANGIGAHVEGYNNQVNEEAAHAEGKGNTVAGKYGHAEGMTTACSGSAAHTEGISTEAKNDAEHAEGKYNKSNTGTSAADKTIHSVGIGDLPFRRKNAFEIMQSGDAYFTGVGGYDGTNYSSAKTLQEVVNEKPGEKVSTPSDSGEIFNDYTNNVASGTYSHAEGQDTSALGNYGSHAEGYQTQAGDSSNDYSSHAEGYQTKAIGRYGAHSEGRGTTASGDYSHAEGYLTTAFGVSSHAEGQGTAATGTCSHAEGFYTTASGGFSHAEGYHTQTYQQGEHAEGTYNKSYDSDEPSKRIIHSVGIGTSERGRKNAHEIKFNGDYYVFGIGGYDGTNPDASKTLQEVVNNTVSTTEQTLTDEEKSQAQTNIGVKDTIDAVGVGEKANIQLTVWKENTIRSSRNGNIGTDNSYKISNTIKINRGDKISTNLYGTSAISIVSEVLNDDIHTYIRTLLNGIASTDEQFFIADKDMWIEICCSNGTFSNGIYITKIGITNNYLPIPNGGYMRNLFVAAGATYNEETGFYELNGLTDITEEEMVDIYHTLNFDFISDFQGRYAYCKARTNILSPLQNNIYGQSNKCTYIALDANFEIFMMPATKVVMFTNFLQAFYRCYNLRKIVGEIRIKGTTDFTATFAGCDKLEEVFLQGVADSLKINNSPFINYDSIKYLVDNAANTEPITVTVHPTTYSYLTGTAEPTEQVGGTTEEWQAIVTNAQEKQISFATTD